jgi:lipopolysaccharide biosynthesis regulator YciM
MTLTAFVARSFDPGDEQRIQPILNFLDTFRKAGFIWESADAAEVESVSKKVRDMIDRKDLFIGFFTRRHPVYSLSPRTNGILQSLFGKLQPQMWSAPPWVLQESGYAIGASKKLLLLREQGVEIPGLQGDLEYIPFDANNLAAVYPKLNEMINDLLAKEAGREVTITVSERSEQAELAIEPAEVEAQQKVAEESAVGEESIFTHFIRMQDAATRADLTVVYEAWVDGGKLVPVDPAKGDIDKLWWDCHYFEALFKARSVDAIDRLRQLAAENPERADPKISLARCLGKSQEHEESAALYLQAALVQEKDGKIESFVSAANAFRSAKLYEQGKKAARDAFLLAGGGAREDVVTSLYQLLKDCGDIYFAFATAEFALQRNPQLPIRSKLGLDYRLADFNELALYHFDYLHDRDPSDSSSLHNLSLLYSDCSLPILAAENYKKSFELGETLSAANLGFEYLDAGMAAEAKLLIQRALAMEPHDARVDTCLAAITERSKDEERKESELLEVATSERKFFSNMGAGLQATTISVDGRWRFPFGEMALTSSSDKIQGAAEISREESSALGLLYGLGGGSEPKGTRTDKYVLEGEITGSVCKFDLTIVEKNIPTFRSILGSSSKRSGFIVFDSNGKCATYVENAEKKFGERQLITRIG